jgi:hypothetical protein
VGPSAGPAPPPKDEPALSGSGEAELPILGSDEAEPMLLGSGEADPMPRGRTRRSLRPSGLGEAELALRGSDGTAVTPLNRPGELIVDDHESPFFGYLNIVTRHIFNHLVIGWPLFDIFLSLMMYYLFGHFESIPSFMFFVIYNVWIVPFQTFYFLQSKL